jgi:hypothetical protein
VAALRAPVDCVPLPAKVPLQPPEAVQDDASVAAQVRVDALPGVTLAGLALSETVGAAADTVTVADWEADPPVPVQVKVNFAVAVSAGVVAVPVLALAPVQPPEAVQDVASVDDQVRAAVAPLLTVVGLADKVTVGAGAVTDTVAPCEAVPPAPVQLSE